MKTLILGGTGNISTEVVAHLLNDGHDVSVMTRGTTAVPTGCKHVACDRYDAQALKTALSQQPYDVAVDFLGFVPEHLEMARDALSGRVGQYVFISSATVYEKPHTTLPITEDMLRGNQFSQYARNKIASEEYLEQAHGKDFPVTIVRPSHTFGHTWIPSPFSGSGDWTVASRIERGLPVIVHDDGRTLWALTAASDFASGLAGLLGNEAAIGEAFHITSDEALTWNGIYLEIGRALGHEPKVVSMPTLYLEAQFPELIAKLSGDKSNHGVFDNTKVKRAVPEFQCAKSFRTAIRESIAWFREDPARQQVNAKADAQVDALLAAWRNSTQS